MVQVKLLKQDGLRHEFSVIVPVQTVESARAARLAEIAKTAKWPGFRPGKAPMSVVEQRHGAEARAEAIDRAVSEATGKALADHKVRPAMQPKVELVNFKEGADVEFTLAVDALPEVKLQSFDGIALERPVAAVEDAKVDAMIADFAKRMREPQPVTDGRAAQTGDVLVIDFDGSVDGEKRPGMKGEGHKLELGSKSFIDTFEDQLVGSKPGDHKTVKVTFPANYHAAELAGKSAVFEVDVKELRAQAAVELNDDLAKETGFPSLDKLRERVREDIDGSYARTSREIAKRALMDALAAQYDFAVPQSLLDAEFGTIWQQVQDAKTKGDLPDEDKGKSEDELKKEYTGIAERRIRLGLLLAEVATQNKIEVSGNELRNALMAEARRFPGQEKAVFDYYTQTQGAMERIRAPLLEEKVVDFLIGKARVTDKSVSADELATLAQED